jgi:hypothetical protein
MMRDRRDEDLVTGAVHECRMATSLAVKPEVPVQESGRLCPLDRTADAME